MKLNPLDKRSRIEPKLMDEPKPEFFDPGFVRIPKVVPNVNT